jgi:DNA-binding FadR family transcriptional regulator
MNLTEAVVFSPVRASTRDARGNGHERLPSRVADQITRAIIEERFRPGDRLPSEKLLGEQFGVSRIVIREALKRLETNGLIKIRPGQGGGAFVQRPSARAINDALYTLLRLEGFEVGNLHEVRLILEPVVAELATLRATPLGLAELERTIAREEAAVTRKQSIIPAMEFHGQLVRMTGNPILVLTVGLISDLIETSHLQHPTPIDLSVEAQAQILREHQAIYAALANHDAAASRRLMADHVRHCAEFEGVERLLDPAS